MNLTDIALVAGGGAVGAVARFQVSWVATALLGTRFPFGTLIANVAGCLLLGALAALSVSTHHISPAARLALGTGFLGAFTTFSTFSYEAVLLLQGGEAGKALGYVGGSVLAGIALVVVGLGVGRAIG